ncbi:hypothetical protein QR680_003906 [Steinernema hermaphroditum]|uniref:E2F/DP family winged-helix DNA-binding domain-containing protein n=1 Tax=Steinernema hermaphroditum TaxID=289476 RepID=A0AA39HN33_9BILA|nr:hypothetical protein QR680_003906 [Steinernema hermaphroditum]
MDLPYGARRQIVQFSVMRSQMRYRVKRRPILINAENRLIPAPVGEPKHSSQVTKRVIAEQLKLFESAGSLRVDTTEDNDTKVKGMKYYSKVAFDYIVEKKEATYQEITQEILKRYFDGVKDKTNKDDARDIRVARNVERRVYEVLNVMAAANIVSKDNKTVRFIGASVNARLQIREMNANAMKRREEVTRKKTELRNLVCQMASYRNLLERNRAAERIHGRPQSETTIPVPNIIVTTDRFTNVDVGITDDKTEYLFQFDRPFQVYDDIDLMKRLGLACGMENDLITLENIEKIKSYVPEALRPDIDQIVNTNHWPFEAFKTSR